HRRADRGGQHRRHVRARSLFDHAPEDHVPLFRADPALGRTHENPEPAASRRISGTFSGLRDGQPWHFSLTTVDYGYWSGRMTAAYPESQADEAEKHLDALLARIRLQRPKAPKR